MNLVSAASRSISLIVIAGLISQPAWAQRANQNEQDEQQTREAGAVRQGVYDKLQKAQQLNELEQHEEALRIVDALLNPDKLSDYELSQVLQFRGFILYSMGNVREALRAFETILDIPGLEPAARKRHLYTIAQLYAAVENYDAAARSLDEWFLLEPSPSSTALIFRAQLRYQLGNYPGMISPIETAIAQALEQGADVREDWYALLSFAYFQQENYEKVGDIQMTLLENWPRKRYWTTLAGAFSELGDQGNLLAAYDVAYTDGLLTQESELITLAQLYLQHEVPHKAALLLQRHIDDGTLEASEKNYRLLSQAWSLAQDDERAIPALSEAARLSDDGEIYVRLGNAHLNFGQYRACVAAVRQGLDKGDLKRPENAQVSLGMCLYNLREYRASLSAFEKALQHPDTRRLASQWIAVLRNELEREKQLELVEAKTREQQQALRARREAQM